MSMTHKYIPKVQQREENLFLEEYYSGTDTKVVLNGNEQSEVSYISYSLSEQLKPIYGYSSRTFDDMAVGNRIVTGILKMPIKNPEDNDSYETITSSTTSTLEEIQNLNQTDETKKNNTEWISSTDTTQNQYTNNNIFEYQSKLIELGYTSSLSGSYDAQTRAAIYKFQSDNNLAGNGTFNNDTMICIDYSLDTGNLKKGIVEGTANIYVGLTTASGIIYTLKENEEFYIVQDLGLFTQIRTLDGKDGYIESSRITEVK